MTVHLNPNSALFKRLKYDRKHREKIKTPNSKFKNKESTPSVIQKEIKKPKQSRNIDSKKKEIKYSADESKPHYVSQIISDISTKKNNEVFDLEKELSKLIHGGNLSDIKKSIQKNLKPGSYKLSRKDTKLSNSFLVIKNEDETVKIFKMGISKDTNESSEGTLKNTDFESQSILQQSHKEVFQGGFGRVSTNLVDMDDPSRKLVIKQLHTRVGKSKSGIKYTDQYTAQEEVQNLNKMGFESTLVSDLKGGINDKSLHGKDKAYIIMDHIEGEEAYQCVKSHYQENGDSPLIEVKDINSIFVELKKKLKPIHDNDCQNFDIKPQNIIISKNKNGWQAKIIDAGMTLSNKKRKEYYEYGTSVYQTNNMKSNRYNSKENKFDLASIVISLALMCKPSMANNPSKEVKNFKNTLDSIPTAHKDQLLKIIESEGLSRILETNSFFDALKENVLYFLGISS